MSKLTREASDRAKRFLGRLKRDDQVSSFLQLLNAQGEAFIFGGAVRDVVFGSPAKVCDLDIVVAGSFDIAEIESRFGTARRTKLGGFRTHIGPFEVDFWDLNKSATLQSYARSEVNLLHLLKNVCFSTDAIAMSTSRFRLIEGSPFVEAYEHRMLEFVRPPLTFDPKVLARIARLVTKHRLQMSVAVASYFVHGLEMFGSSKILDVELGWGEFSFLNGIQIENVRAELEMAIEKAFATAK